MNINLVSSNTLLEMTYLILGSLSGYDMKCWEQIVRTPIVLKEVKCGDNTGIVKPSFYYKRIQFLLGMHSFCICLLKSRFFIFLMKYLLLGNREIGEVSNYIKQWLVYVLDCSSNYMTFHFHIVVVHNCSIQTFQNISELGTPIPEIITPSLTLSLTAKIRVSVASCFREEHITLWLFDTKQRGNTV